QDYGVYRQGYCLVASCESLGRGVLRRSHFITISLAGINFVTRRGSSRLHLDSAYIVSVTCESCLFVKVKPDRMIFGHVHSAVNNGRRVSEAVVAASHVGDQERVGVVSEIVVAHRDFYIIVELLDEDSTARLRNDVV